MVVLNAVVFRSKKDNCYVAHGCLCGQIGTGETKGKATDDLAKAIMQILDEKKEDSDVELINRRNFDPDILGKFEQVVMNSGKYNMLERQIGVNRVLRVYDFP